MSNWSPYQAIYNVESNRYLLILQEDITSSNKSKEALQGGSI